MRIRCTVLALATGLGMVMNASIITRHDIPDEAHVTFAQRLPMTPALVRYNATDMAGTVVAPQWLVSAAHVAETIEPGQYLHLQGGDSVAVALVVLHPGWIYNGRPEDIALIKLTEAPPGIQPVKLYTDHDELDKEVIVVGNGDFGTGRTGPAGNDGRLRAATNRVDNVSPAYLTWDFTDPREHPDTVTRLEGISGPGDSGGPAFIRRGDSYLLAGISSGQSTRATGGQEGRYGVTEYYTRVSTYAHWINRVIAE